MQLRPYQEAAVTAVYDHLRNRDDNPCVVLPTGTGKSLVIGKLASDAVERWNGRVLILAHVKELLQQNADKLRGICPKLPVGIYSAGLKRRDTDTPVLVAGIQSVYRKACDLDPFDLVIVDECHTIPKDGEGIYRRFLKDCLVINPQLRVIGLTATPYRLDSGLVCTPEHFINHVCYEAGLREMIRDGYLTPLVPKEGMAKADLSGLHVRGGEFISNEVDAAMNQPDLVIQACDKIVAYSRDRQAVMIFACSVAHGQQIVQVLAQRHGIECGFVSDQTSSAQRDELLCRLRGDSQPSLLGTAPLKYICNVNVLTTGVDVPRVDCIALLRATQSAGLLVQMVGRGTRLYPGKQNCLILDYGGNIERHGPIDQIRTPDKRRIGVGGAPAKKCENCNGLVATGYANCPQCGHPFPPPQRAEHAPKASSAGVLSGQITDVEYEVLDTVYRVHTKRDAADDDPRTMRVDYRIGLKDWHSEFVCLEHSGFAFHKAKRWWRERSPDPIPDSIEQAVAIAEAGGVATSLRITVRSIAGEKYDRIIKHELGEMPQPIEFRPADPYDDDEVPF